MNDITKNESFIKAQEKYEEVQKLLNAMVDSYLNDTNDQDFSREIFLRQYDFTLQTILLAVGLADGCISEEEGEAIRLIAKNGSILDYLNRSLEDGEEPWTMDNFTKASPYLVARTQMILEKRLEDIIDNFTEFVVVIAAKTEDPSKLISALKNLTKKVIEYTICVDGKYSDDEHDVTNIKYDEVLNESIQRSIRKLAD